MYSAEEALNWLESGNTARVTAATQMNQRSSRSHAVFTLHVGESAITLICSVMPLYTVYFYLTVLKY